VLQFSALADLDNLNEADLSNASLLSARVVYLNASLGRFTWAVELADLL
jgi:hypothetical protein